MNYRVRVNGKVIEESIARNEVERRAQTSWLKAQARGLRVEVAETGTQNFRPLDQFLYSAPPAAGGVGHSLPQSSSQSPFGAGGGAANSPPSPPRLAPTSFNNPTQPRVTAPPAQVIQPVQAFPSAAAAPVSYQNNAPQSFPAPSSAPWAVVAETNRLDPMLRGYIRPEHYGHNGPWLVRGHDLVPIAGLWICNAARSIDSVLTALTFGIYLFFMLNAIAQSRQTLGQKLAGVRMVRQGNLSPASAGQFLGSGVCFVVLSLIPVIGLLIFAQAFTEKKQGLNHMLCQVMHLEDRHYDASRGFWLTALGIAGSFIAWVIFLVLVSVVNQS